MENSIKMQGLLVEKFLKQHFKVKRIKKGGRFKRVILGFDDEIYHLNNVHDIYKLKHHLINVLGDVFSFDEYLSKKIVNRFI